jgi:hypothetical protein
MQSHSIAKLNIKKTILIVDFYFEHIGNIFDTLHWTIYMTIQGNI